MFPTYEVGVPVVDFVYKRLKGWDKDTKRFMRVNDIEGASPKKYTSISNEQRVKAMNNDQYEMFKLRDEQMKKRFQNQGMLNIYKRGGKVYSQDDSLRSLGYAGLPTSVGYNKSYQVTPLKRDTFDNISPERMPPIQA